MPFYWDTSLQAAACLQGKLHRHGIHFDISQGSTGLYEMVAVGTYVLGYDAPVVEESKRDAFGVQLIAPLARSAYFPKQQPY